MSKKKTCEVLGVSRGSIYHKGKKRAGRYKKKEDPEVLRQINEVLEKRPTYGYPRVTAKINEKRVSEGHKNYSENRVYRVMSINDLTLKPSCRRRKHKPTGKIITFSSNVRWCSDGFEIHCFNGEKVYVSFVLDCHDREVISFTAQKRPLLAQDIQKIMLESVEKRFKSSRVPRAIQFLSDRGAIYRCHKTVQMGRQLGLESCFTKAYSPESNGMSEALVNTIKRDYVYVSDCKDSDTTLKLIKTWFKDYNEEAPHSGLGMKSPVEYRKNVKLGV